MEGEKLDPSLGISGRTDVDDVHLNDSARIREKYTSTADVQNSLRQEIMQLEKRLQNQVAVRFNLEKDLGYKPSPCNLTTDEVLMPKPATELIKEISVLEVEVGHLEQYLLTLYRKAFDQQIASISPSANEERTKSALTLPQGEGAWSFQDQMSHQRRLLTSLVKIFSLFLIHGRKVAV